MQRYLDDRGHHLSLCTEEELQQTGVPPDTEVALVQYRDEISIEIADELHSKMPDTRIVLVKRLGTGHIDTVYPQLHTPAKSRQLFAWIEEKAHLTPPKSGTPASLRKEVLMGSLKRDRSHSKSPMLSRIKVLLAEDNSVNQKVVLNILSKHGYQIDIASNGQEALEKAKSCKYDIILMDWQMPILDGIEATKKIRVFDAVTPIIALTAAAHQEQECKDAGMQDYLLKPFKPTQLRDVVAKWLPSTPKDNSPLDLKSSKDRKDSKGPKDSPLSKDGKEIRSSREGRGSKG